MTDDGDGGDPRGQQPGASRISQKATGWAMMEAVDTGSENCRTSSRMMSAVRAPSTFLIPISQVQRSADGLHWRVKARRPARLSMAAVRSSGRRSDTDAKDYDLRVTNL